MDSTLAPAPAQPAVPPDAAHRLTLANELAELRRMSEWLVRAARDCGLPPARIADLDVCANEAVANIISYAYDDPGQHAIHLRLARGGDAVTLVIEDDGRPFDPLSAALAPAPASLAEASIGGLGLRLIRGMMDHCEYRRQGGSNFLSFTARV